MVVGAGGQFQPALPRAGAGAPLAPQGQHLGALPGAGQPQARPPGIATAPNATTARPVDGMPQGTFAKTAAAAQANAQAQAAAQGRGAVQPGQQSASLQAARALPAQTTTVQTATQAARAPGAGRDAAPNLLLAQALAAALATKGKAAAEAQMALLSARQAALAALTGAQQSSASRMAGAQMGPQAAPAHAPAQGAGRAAQNLPQGPQQATPSGTQAARSGTAQGADGEDAATLQARGKAGKSDGAPAQASQLPPAAQQTGMAAALRRAAKKRARDTLDRVEAVSRHMPGRGHAEAEEEDWQDEEQQPDGDDSNGGCTAEDMAREAARRQAAQQDAASQYQALAMWLLACGQQAALRELASGRCVLLLAPMKGAQLRLGCHLLVPDGAAAGHVGAQGHAWEQPARWEPPLPADVQWRAWRLRQAAGPAGWQLVNSHADLHTPRLVVAEDAPLALPATTKHGVQTAECITLLQARRLRRLLGSQLTVLALRAPLPPDACPAQPDLQERR